VVLLSQGSNDIARMAGHRVKRVILGSAPVLCLIYSGLLVWSFLGNRDLQQQVLAAGRAIPDSEGAGGAVPGLDSLRSLESLRVSLVKLTEYERDGAPLRLRFVFTKALKFCPTCARFIPRSSGNAGSIGRRRRGVRRRLARNGWIWPIGNSILRQLGERFTLVEVQRTVEIFV